MDASYLGRGRLRLLPSQQDVGKIPIFNSSARQRPEMFRDVLPAGASCQTLGFVLGTISLQRRRCLRRVCRVARHAGGVIDYYEVLGVSKSANEREIKSSFRKLASPVSSRHQQRARSTGKVPADCEGLRGSFRHR